MVKLKVRSPEVIGSIPTSMSVTKLRALLHRLYRDQAGRRKLRISLVSSANMEQEVQMNNDMRKVSFYLVSSILFDLQKKSSCLLVLFVQSATYYLFLVHFSEKLENDKDHEQTK